MRRLGRTMVVLAGLSGCGQAGAEAELAGLRETVAAQASAMAALQWRLDALDAALKEERAERVREMGELRSQAPAADATPPVMPSCAGDSCVLQRAEVDAVLADPASLARLARVIPMMKDGETKGFKVYGIRANTPLSQLGLKNGDTILSIAGVELNSVEAAMALPEALRARDRWTIAGVRKDMPFELAVEVR